ncbi:MAG: hypothetical protein LBR76_00070 [Oscillospiraceae bacterium]|nr:hypothetical protein [Oscillospiraceae bacterium]
MIPKSYEDLDDAGKIQYHALKEALMGAGSNLIEGLKTRDQKEALDTVDDLEGMSDLEFDALVEQRCQGLNDFMFSEVKRIISRRKLTHSAHDPLSLRATILLDIAAMTRSR